jgi:PAS domain S-box-containing protein
MFIAGMLVLGVVMQVIVLRIFLKPLSLLDKYAKNVTAGNFAETLEVKSGDELESLTESVKEMVDGLKEKVAEKTAQLEKTLGSLESKNTDLERSNRAVLNVLEDLSIEKDQLANESNRLATILASIGDGVFVVDKAGRITMMNQTAFEMSGTSLNESLGKYYSKVFEFKTEGKMDKVYPDFVKKVLETGKQESLTSHTVIVHKNGTTIPVLDSASPIKNAAGKLMGCVVVFRNNTKERELERSKDDFLSVTSHQLRTPLGGMRWNLEMLIDGDAGKIPKEAKDLAEQIYISNLRMISLVNDLLNVNRLDQGRVLDNPVETDLLGVIKDVVQEIDPEAKKKEVVVTQALSAKTPHLIIDPKRFREVISNLVSNAVKYNKPKGKVEIKTYSKAKEIVIEVSDTGVGIPKKDQPRLFQKFYRASNAVQSEAEGSGLGLYVVKMFVEMWGGKIDLASEEGVGTKISIHLPLIIKKLNRNE